MRLVVVLFAFFTLSPVLADSTEFQSYQQRARINFALFCSGCHQMSGKGAPDVVPDLGEYLGHFAQHPESRSFLVQVPGASSSPLDNKELAEVTNWILYTMNADQLEDDFIPYTEKEVAEYRKDPLLEVILVRDKLVETLQQNYQVDSYE